MMSGARARAQLSLLDGRETREGFGRVIQAVYPRATMRTTTGLRLHRGAIMPPPPSPAALPSPPTGSPSPQGVCVGLLPASRSTPRRHARPHPQELLPAARMPDAIPSLCAADHLWLQQLPRPPGRRGWRARGRAASFTRQAPPPSSSVARSSVSRGGEQHGLASRLLGRRADVSSPPARTSCPPTSSSATLAINRNAERRSSSATSTTKDVGLEGPSGCQRRPSLRGCQALPSRRERLRWTKRLSAWLYRSEEALSSTGGESPTRGGHAELGEDDAHISHRCSSLGSTTMPSR